MKLANFDFRIWDKGEKTLTYASKDWKLGISFSNPQQDNGEVESVLHAYYDGEPMCPDDCEIELWSGFYDSKGIKIYENDIVCCYFAMNGLVIFENAMFYVLNQHSGEKKTLFEALHESQAEKEPFVVESNIHFEKDNECLV